MLVRNLRKVGDYERSILSQEENLRMAIANDRNIAQARSQIVKGMVPELTPDQMKSREEILTDRIAIQGKAQENLLTLYPKETVAKFMEGLTTETMTYLNVYWNDLKPIFKNKTGLNKTYFDRILKQHIQNITDARGMSTVQSSGARNSALNELAEARKLGFSFLMGDPKLLRDIKGKLKLASGNRPMSKAAMTLRNVEGFQASLPTEQILAKVETRPEVEKQQFYSDLISLFQNMFDPNEAAWQDAFLSDPSELQRKLDEKLIPIISPRFTAKLRPLYAPYI